MKHDARRYRADAKLEVLLRIHIPHFNFNSYYYTNQSQNGFLFMQYVICNVT